MDTQLKEELDAWRFAFKVENEAQEDAFLMGYLKQIRQSTVEKLFRNNLALLCSPRSIQHLRYELDNVHQEFKKYYANDVNKAVVAGYRKAKLLETTPATETPATENPTNADIVASQAEKMVEVD